MPGESIFSRPSLSRTLVFVAIGAMLFVAIDTVLANTERHETALDAARLNAEGERLMQQKKFLDAATAFRSAIAKARDNTQYPLALSNALLSAGQLEEADDPLNDLLRANPMAGAPNLAMARVLAKQGQFEQATFYYHRAIYGQWKDNNAGNEQLQTRFELADLLAQRNLKGQLLSELLPLQEEAPADAATQKKIAGLFLTANSPARALAIFREQARVHRDDADAHKGMGDAELQLGNFIAAEAAFNAALRAQNDRADAKRGLEVAQEARSLDPLNRGIADSERLARSQQILQQVVDKFARCPSPSPEAVALAEGARTSKGGTFEANLDLAGKLWRDEQACPGAATEADAALRLVLEKAAR